MWIWKCSSIFKIKLQLCKISDISIGATQGAWQAPPQAFNYFFFLHLWPSSNLFCLRGVSVRVQSFLNFNQVARYLLPREWTVQELGKQKREEGSFERLWVGKCGFSKDKSGHQCQAAPHVPSPPTPLFDIGHDGVSDCCHRWLIFLPAKGPTSDRGQSCLFNLFQHWDVAGAASHHR